MKLKPFLVVLLFLSITIIQLALEGSFNFFSGKINLTLIFVVIFINLLDFNWVIFFVLFSGLLLDIYSGLPFGLITLSLMLTAILCQLLFVNFFTNFSLYSSLILCFIAVLFYNLCLAAGLLVLYSLGLADFFMDLDYTNNVLFQLVFNLLLIFLFYWLVNNLSKRLKPIFLR